MVKMEVVVCRSCLQRPKDVIFEGVVTRFGYGLAMVLVLVKKKASWRKECLGENVSL